MSRDVSTRRDENLGAALRELETPEHAPDFYATLHHRLADDRVGRIADARPRQSRARTRWTARVAVVAAVAAVVFAAIGIPRGERTPIGGPGLATAAPVSPSGPTGGPRLAVPRAHGVAL